MRFKRTDRHPFTDTPRKRAALARKQRRERDALPLFAGEIANEQRGTDEIMADRAKAWANDEARMRQREAQTWRKARARLASYTDRERAALLAYWQRCGWPATGTYLLSMLHMYDNGRLEAVADALK